MTQFMNKSGKNLLYISLLHFFVIEMSLTNVCVVQASEADKNPYSFDMSCASLDTMTMEAKSAMSRIRAFAKQTQDDPNCTNFKSKLSANLERLDKDGLSFLKPENKIGLDIARTTNQIETLHTAQRGDPIIASYANSLMINAFSKMTGLMGERAKKGQAPSSVDNNNLIGSNGNDNNINSSDGGGNLNALTPSQRQEISVAVRMGLDITNDVIDEIPKSKECLKDPVFTSQIFSGLIKTLSVFAGSGLTGTGSSFATTISKLGNVLRDSDFSDAYRKLNKQEFLISLSCLTEMTEKNYCDVRDNRILLAGDKNISLDPNQIKSQEQEDYKNELFEGFYVLNQHLPNITLWLQGVQFGIEPQTGNDADFKNQILDEQVTYFKTLNSFEGDFNRALLNIQETREGVEAQRALLVQLVINLKNRLIETKMTNLQVGGGVSKQNQNFFEAVIPESRILWYLLGREDVNPSLLCLGGNGMTINCDIWLRDFHPTMPEFQNPIELAEKIHAQYLKLRDSSYRTLVDYFNRWFIVDRPNLVADAMTSSTYSVTQSFEAIDIYLSHLVNRIHDLSPKIYASCQGACPTSFNDSLNVISVIEQTQFKIRNILAGFNNLKKNTLKLQSVDEYSKFSEKDKTDANLAMLEFEKNYVNLIADISKSLNIMLARTGYLSRRIETFVYHDISLILKSNVGLSQYERFFYFQSGKLILNNLRKIYGNNLATAETDMDQALVTNKSNIEALEGLFKDNFIAFIAEAKMVSENRPPNWKNLMSDYITRNYEDEQDLTLLESPENQFRVPQDPEKEVEGTRVKPIHLGYGINFFPQIFTHSPLKSAINSWIHSDRYPTKSMFIKNDSNSPDTEFNSQKNLFAKLCLLSLGFNDWKPFYRLCAEAKMVSPITTDILGGNGSKLTPKDLEMNYRDQLVAHWQDPKINHSKRICSFRDYLRRNQVAYMLKDANIQNRMNESLATGQILPTSQEANK